MKKLFMMMAAVVLLAGLAISCQKEENGVDDLPVFTAHADDGGMKTDLAGNYVVWNSSDRVKVFGDFGYAIYGVAPRGDDPTWATLSPIENHGITGFLPYRFVYPASIASGGDANNLLLYVTYPSERDINDAPLTYFPMYGESDHRDVVFHNLGGLFKFVLPEISRNITMIQVTADEAMVGTFTIEADGGCSFTSAVADAFAGVLIDAHNQTFADGSEVYVAVPAQEYHNLTLRIFDDQGYMATKTGSAVNVAQSAVTTINVSNLNFTRIQAPTLMGYAFSNFSEAKPIVFHYNYDQWGVEGAERIDDGQSYIPIWRKINANQVDVYTPAVQINAPANCDWMFGGCSATSIDFGDGFNTSNVTNMNYMFGGCQNLTSLDLSSFNTENVTDMGHMFLGCENLTSLNLSSFNTENVTDMNWMFGQCQNLTSLNLSSFNTANVTNMGLMFYWCLNLTSLNLSSFNTANVTDMGLMFYYCQSLTSLNLSSFNTANVINMGMMFCGCPNLTSLNLSSFNTANVTDMSQMFTGCHNLTSLNLSSFNTANVTDMHAMFHSCRDLTSLDLSSFNTSNVTNMSDMFNDCLMMTSIEFASSATINSAANIEYILSGLGIDAPVGCTIHCNESVKNRLMSSTTNYNSRFVHFNTTY